MTDEEGQTDRLSQTILRLCRDRGVGKTICPSEVARALEPNEAAWRSLLPSVRSAAASLAREGQISVFRKGKAIDPNAIKGVVRLGLPKGD